MFSLSRPGGPPKAAPSPALPEPAVGPLQSVLNSIHPKPRPPELRQPEREYLILFTPRSGSSHLVEILTSAGLADPREWLHPDFLQERAEMFGTTTFADYFAALRGACSRKGVFGHKMALTFYERFSDEVRMEDHFDFKSPTVFLYRDDIVQQAVSLVLAEGREFWHAMGDVVPSALSPVPYDPLKIHDRLAWLAAQERLTEAFIEAQGPSVRYLSYETLISREMPDVARAFAGHVGIELRGELPVSSYRKIGDSLNLDYADRFRSEHPDLMEHISEDRRDLLQTAARMALL